MRKIPTEPTGSLFDPAECVRPSNPELGAATSRGPSHSDTRDTAAPTKDLRALGVEMQATDLWASRARPTFLYIMYAMILWALPMGLVAAISPRVSHAITAGMTDYLSALPAELYTLFGTGYLGYATLRQWGKVKGTDR
jgi:hypothetical protein